MAHARIKIGDTVTRVGADGFYVVVEADKFLVRLRRRGESNADMPWAQRTDVVRVAEDDVIAAMMGGAR